MYKSAEIFSASHDENVQRTQEDTHFVSSFHSVAPQLPI